MTNIEQKRKNAWDRVAEERRKLEARIVELEAQLAAATAEITRMRERLAALSEEWRTTETSSLRVNEMLLAHADALTEAIAAAVIAPDKRAKEGE